MPLRKRVLDELSEFLCGVVHQGINDNLCVYPGSIAMPTRDLLPQPFFRDIYARLHFHDPRPHAEMYA